jgi:hypothetical protein
LPRLPEAAALELSMMMRFVRSIPFAGALFAVLWLASQSHASAAEELPRIEIYEFGLYESGESLGESHPPNQGFRHEFVSHVTHLETTNIVPGRLGITFGVRYRVHSEGTVVPTRIVLRFPEQGLYNPQFPTALPIDVTESLQLDGDEGFNVITFTEQWEIEPGIWKFEFWIGDEKSSEQIFEVITPPIS